MQESKARQSFFTLGKEFGHSIRYIKKAWYIYKHLPVKENDTILFLTPHNLLQSWLLKYGIAKDVHVLVFPEDNQLDLYMHSFIKIKSGKEYLGNLHLRNCFAENTVSVIYNLLCTVDMVIAIDASPFLLNAVCNQLASGNISTPPRFYLSMTHNEAALVTVSSILMEDTKISFYEHCDNDERHYAWMNVFAMQLQLSKGEHVKLKMVASPLKKKMFLAHSYNEGGEPIILSRKAKYFDLVNTK